jgi:lysine 2,3-aminomutase
VDANTLWQNQLREAVSSLEELAGSDYAFLRSRGPAAAVSATYKVLVPRYYLGLIQKDDPEDPIARMAFPTAEEANVLHGLRDPIGDLSRQAVSRLTHRYRDRALLHVTNLCPMYCRFCFRKNLMNEREADLYSGDFAEAMNYLAAHGEIEEVILTGGDPWMLTDGKIGALVDELAARMPHLRRLRFHSRMPVTLPARITTGLVEAIRRPGRVQTFVVTHFNHPRELSVEARAGLQLLRNAGITTLNQSVLLKGVNASAPVLRELYRGLGNEGVLPYYLHHCDLVAGAEHFRLSIPEGRKIWAELRGTLPGYLIPEYILDTPGGWGKIPIGAEFLQEKENGGSYRLVRGGEYADPDQLS